MQRPTFAPLTKRRKEKSYSQGLVEETMFVGSVIFRFIGVVIKWLLSGFKGGMAKAWRNRDPNKEFEDILIGVGVIVVLTILIN
jgi:hypothetical protein